MASPISIERRLEVSKASINPTREEIKSGWNRIAQIALDHLRELPERGILRTPTVDGHINPHNNDLVGLNRLSREEGLNN